jgi:DNA-binding HxlR family transcriptional regulator
MLTLTLRHLERDGLLSRTARAEVPRVECQLTPLGGSLCTVVTALARRATGHGGEVKSARRAFGNRSAFS